jgi:hypothetical protein
MDFAVDDSKVHFGQFLPLGGLVFGYRAGGFLMPQRNRICRLCGEAFPPHDGKPRIDVCRDCIPAYQPQPERKPPNPLKEGGPEERALRRAALKKGRPLSLINAILHGDE